MDLEDTTKMSFPRDEKADRGQVFTYESNENSARDALSYNKDTAIVEDVERNDIDADDSSSIERTFGLDRSRLKQSLKQRHIQMIALVGVFGTGIFLSSGGVLATAGPLGCLLAYILIGAIVGMNQIAMAEVGSLMPVTQANIRHLEHFADDALGFGYGWLSVWSSLMPGEISSSAVIVTYWSDLSPAIWISIFIVLIVAANSWSVRFYGELEFFFACLKLLLLVGLIILSIVITSGGGPSGEKTGFKFWKEGLFNSNYLKLTPKSSARFAGFYKALSGTVFSYGGVQSIATLGAEVQYPRRAIFTASKRIFIRVVTLMVTTIFLLTLIVSSKDKRIASSTGTAEHSPFVIAATNANIKVIPHIINAVVLTSAFSVSNTALVGGSRTLFALAVRKQAPAIFLRTNKRGLPYVGMGLVVLFMPLAYMSVSKGSSSVFNWFQTLTSSNLLIGWIFISLSHIQMSRAIRAQGYTRKDLPHSMKFAEASAWISGVASLILLLTSGFVNFIHGHFSASSFVGSYITIPIIVVLTLFWKFFKKTKWRGPHDIDLEVLFNDVKENPEPPAEKLRGWKILTLLWS